MESIYSALLLYKAGKEITEGAIEKILKAADVKADKAQIKKLVAGLQENDIESIIASAAAVPAMAAPGGGGGAAAEEAEEEEPTGIGSLF